MSNKVERDNIITVVVVILKKKNSKRTTFDERDCGEPKKNVARDSFAYKSGGAAYLRMCRVAFVFRGEYYS